MASMSSSHGWHDVRRKPSGKWEARWSDETGKTRGKCFLTKTQAQKHSWDMANDILNASVGIAPAQKSFRDALASFLDRRIKASSLALYERYIEEFLARFPNLVKLGQVETKHICEYDRWMEDKGRNPGGRSHAMRPLRTFFKFCMVNDWLTRTPFLGFSMPSSTYKSRALNSAEFEKMISVDPRPRYTNVDVVINEAVRLGRLTMLRRSQVWKLTPKEFRAPDQLWVEGIKKQAGVWITLLPEAADIIASRCLGRASNQRLFDRWKSADAMKQSIHDKACRVGLKGVRFHDAGKVTRITELDAQGFGIGEISVLSNTTAATLARFYIQSDRQRTFEKYKQHYLDRPQTEGRPKSGLNGDKSVLPETIKPNEFKREIRVKYNSILNSARVVPGQANFRAHSSIG